MDLTVLEAIANGELTRHGLKGWTFAFANTKRRLGACKFRARRIEIAKYYALNNSDESVMDTLYHEIAHAIAGANAQHGPKWKAVAARLGAKPTACDRSQKIKQEPGSWQAKCPTCRQLVHLYRRPMSLTGYRCSCKAKSPLMFEYKGDPSRRPHVPLTIEDSANWEAKCVGCQTRHFRVRKPKAGTWRCACAKRCVLRWHRKLKSQQAPSATPKRSA
jgi:predicted SprT family Zn-dependent metalloprotease